MQTVYLSGPISGRTYGQAATWRDHAADRLRKAGFRVLDPMRGKSFLSNQKAIEREVYEQWNDPRLSDEALYYRDYNDVRQADIILANVTGAHKGSTGTISEIAWAGPQHKLIVLVMEEDNPHDHPFIRVPSLPPFRDLDSALDYIISCGVEEDAH